MNIIATPNHKDSSALASWLLTGAWIVAIEYFRTGWSVIFALSEKHPAVKAGFLLHPFELVLRASEVAVTDPARWAACVSMAPVDIEARSGYHDALAALVLFNSVAYTVTGAHTEDEGDLILCFEGGRTLRILGRVENTDGEWSIADKWSESKDVPNTFLCADAGNLYAAQELLAASTLSYPTS